MKEECLICKSPLEYLETDEGMECEVCHKKENSKRCLQKAFSKIWRNHSCIFANGHWKITRI